MGDWEHFAHGADIGIRGFGRSPAEAFEHAAQALTAVVTDLAQVRPLEAVPVDCEVPDRELRKVKNRVAARNYRKLENNMSLLVQLAFAEAILDWREINEGPAKEEAVTAADIRRVANRYFGETNRSVAVYRRRPAAATAPAAEGAP